MIKAAIFDLDNTIIDSVETIWRCADHVLRNKGFSGIDRKTAEKAMGLTIFDMFAIAEPHLSQEQMGELFQEYKKCYMDFVKYSKVLPHAQDVLEYARWKGLQLALVTMKSRENAIKVLRSFGLSEFFSAFIGFEDTKEHKPSPEPILKAAAAVGVDAKETVVIGDTDMDIRAGKSAGAATVAVMTGVTPIEKIQEAKPDYTIKDLVELKKILSSLSAMASK